MVMEPKQKYFIFMDESGNNSQDPFFILGILIVDIEQIGKLFNFLEIMYSKIQERAMKNKIRRIDDDYKAGNIEIILSRAKAKDSYEMKFSNINQENDDLYCQVINEYFHFSNVRFSVVIFNRQDLYFQPDGMSHWDRYLNNAAMLITNNINRITTNAEFVVIADQITQSKNEQIYENALFDKIKYRLQKKEVPIESIWGVLRLESHSSTFLQLADILVGAVSYDFAQKNQPRKEKFMESLRMNLGLHRIDKDIDITFPNLNYFSIWKFDSVNQK